MKYRQIKATLLLMLTSMIWGAAFLVQKIGMNDIGPLAFHSIRYGMAGIALVPVALYGKLKRKNTAGVRPRSKKAAAAGGVICGIILGLAAISQQLGILYEPSSGKAGFISTLYMIIVPLLGLFLRRKAPFTVWIAAAVATFGLYLLCIKDTFTLGKGDYYLFLCAFLFAVHILLIDYFVGLTDWRILACAQYFVSSLVGFIAMAFTGESVTLSGIGNAMIPLLYTGVLSAGVGYTIQIVAQKDLHPAIASLVMSLESVFAAVLGWLIAVLTGEFVEENTLSSRETVGCVIMFIAILISQSDELAGFFKAKKRKNETEQNDLN